MTGTHVPVARFLPEPEAYAVVGRLRAEGMDARVAPQGDTLYPYRGHGTGGAVFMVLVPERDGARARWILDHLEGGGDSEDTDDGLP